MRSTRARGSDDQPGLRAAQQLVAAESDDVGACGQRLARRGLVRQPVILEVHQRAAAKVGDQGQVVLVGEPGQLVLGHSRGESLYGVVAGVHLHQRRRARRDRAGVVLEVGAVGGADLDQLHAGARHDVGYAEGAADLDQLAARHRHFLLQAKRVQHEVDRRGVVVDDQRRLGAGQADQLALDVLVALPAVSAVEIELEVDGARHRERHRLRRLRRHDSAPQVRMQHRSGQVERRLERRLHFAREVLGARAHEPGFFENRIGTG